MTAKVQNAFFFLAVLFVVAGGVWHTQVLSTAAAVAAIAATLVRFDRLPTMARLFVVGALVAGPAVSLVHPEQFEEMKVALFQGVAFAGLLSTIGVMRHAVRRSAIARDATRFLVSVPDRSRYAAVNVGCHFLSLLFNVGIIALVGEMLGEGHVSRTQRRHLLLAGMRGTVLMTVWSPMGIGFAIVTTGIVGLDPVRFLVLSFVAAILLLGVTCAVFGSPQDEPETTPDEAPRSALPVVVVMAVSAVLLAATVGLHQWLGMSFIVAATAVIPIAALLWVVLEPADDGRGPVDHVRAMVSGLSDMRGESAIFLSANVIGAAISILLRTQSFWGTVQNGAWPDLWIIGACLLVLPIAGALMIPHSIFVVLIVQLFGNGAAGQHYPMTMALALTLGWAMAITVSPISAMSLITGNLNGVSSHVVGFDWNARFFLTLLALSSTLIFLTYRLGM